MQHHGPTASPPPHVHLQDTRPPRLPDAIIVGLFALRLARRLIETLEYYPGRDADLLWIDNFLAPFPAHFALARISGRRRDDYLATYPRITAQMRRQPRYPVCFMQLHPDRLVRRATITTTTTHESGRETAGEMSDAQRLAIIDFCDAASEWGSVVPIPEREAGRMVELANQRRIADIDTGLSARGNLLDQAERSPPVRNDEQYHDGRQ